MRAVDCAGPVPPTLLVLDNALDHGSYRPAEHWSRVAGRQLEAVWVAGGEALPDPGTHSHVILTGSEASILERAPWAHVEAAWVRQAVASGVRLLGSCWGHQLLAFALGGQECVRRAARPELGWIDVTVAVEGGLLPAGSFAAFALHFDEVVAGSHADLQVLASSPSCAVQALRWGSLPVFGTQSHPEIDPETGRALLAEVARYSPAQASLIRDALAASPRDSGAARPLLEAFLTF